MILKCPTCAAPIDLSQWSSGQYPAEVKCNACGSMVAVSQEQRTSEPASNLLSTDQNSPRFQPATSTLDAPVPDEEFEFEPALIDATRRPRDVLMAPGTQPLDRPLPLGEITATSSGRKPPPLPGQRPTATTTGMPAPSMVSKAMKTASPTLPIDAPAHRKAESAGRDGPLTGELASNSLAPRDADFSSVAPSHPNLESRAGLVQQTSKDMPAILPPEPSLIEAVDHLTTGEIPQVTVGSLVAKMPDFDDEAPDELDPAMTFEPQTNSRVSFLSGMVLSAVVAFGAYFVMDGSLDSESPSAIVESSNTDLARVEQLMAAARFEDRDTNEARQQARTLYQTILNSTEEGERPELRQAAAYGLARIALTEVQYSALRKEPYRQQLSEVEDSLRTLEHPRAGLLRLRTYRLMGQTDFFQSGIDRYTGAKDSEYRLERALRQAPTIKADPAERLRQLDALADDLQSSPAVWALRTEAAMASGRVDAATKILEVAPRGANRAYFLQTLGAQNRSQSMNKKTTPKMGVQLPKLEVKSVADAKVEAAPKVTARKAQTDPGSKTAADPRLTSPKPVQKKDGVDFESIMSKGISLLERGDEKRAEVMFKKAAEARPKRPEPHTNLGYCAHSRKRYGKAIQHFERALRLRGGYADALYGLGNAYRAMGRSADARKTFRRYLDRHPRGPHARMARARLEDLGDSD